MDETEASTSGADVPTKVSQHEAVERIREAESIRVHLPIVGWVPFPRPENIVFYCSLAALAVFNLIPWWAAVVITGLASALNTRSKRTSRQMAAAIDQLCTEVRRLNERLDGMLRRNGEGDQAPAEGTDHNNE
jgi:hypothetical protein